MRDAALMTVSAWLWNGKDKLAGFLVLTQDRLRFQLRDFPDSHLQMEIPLSDIEQVDTFMVFGFARLGLQIRSASHRNDRFILEDLKSFHQRLQAQIKKALDPGR